MSHTDVVFAIQQTMPQESVYHVSSNTKKWLGSLSLLYNIKEQKRLQSTSLNHYINNFIWIHFTNISHKHTDRIYSCKQCKYFTQLQITILENNINNDPFTVSYMIDQTVYCHKMFILLRYRTINIERNNINNLQTDWWNTLKQNQLLLVINALAYKVNAQLGIHKYSYEYCTAYLQAQSWSSHFICIWLVMAEVQRSTTHTSLDITTIITSFNVINYNISIYVLRLWQ